MPDRIGSQTLRTSPSPSVTGDGGGRYGAQVQASIDAFHARLRSVLHHDALSLAQGNTPFREGDTLSAEQQAQLQDAAGDLFLSLPVGSLAPGAREALIDAVGGREFRGQPIDEVPLRDLGHVGRALAKDWVRGLRDESPAGYYGLLASAAAAVGYLAWTDGSDGLRRLGIKPETRLRLLGDKLDLRVGANWRDGFEDFNPTLGVGTRVDLGNGHSLNGRANFDGTGFRDARLGYDVRLPDFSLSADANSDGQGLKDVGANLSLRRDAFSLSGGARYDVRGNRLSVNADATYEPSENVSYALSASHDGKEGRVGVGVKVRF